MIDMNTVDSIEQISITDKLNNVIIDRSELDYLQQPIKDQYISLKNLGTDLTKNIEKKYLLYIYEDLINFVNENYLSIISADDILASPIQTLNIGKNVYKFLIVDCVNTIIPHYMNTINCIDIEQFDSYLKKVLKNDTSNFKTSFIKPIKSILDRFLSLQNLDNTALKNKKYSNILEKYSYYIELINYGDSENFLYNFFHPVVTIYSDEIKWRSSWIYLYTHSVLFSDVI